MAFSSRLLAYSLLSLLACSAVHAQLSPNFYSSTCPNVRDIVRNEMTKAVAKERRMAGSILRLFFHDCFVNGCDASILLDGNEKNAPPNANSVRGFEVIDAIKARVEAACKGTVSCADVLALAALEGVAAVGGPRWTLGLGRRDSKTASAAATSSIPPPFFDLPQLISSFAAQGLGVQDLVALSGGHTLGLAQCQNFRAHIYNDTNIDPSFAASRKADCPLSGGDGNLAPLDDTSNRFDNSYFKNLVAKKGLLHSDQELFNGGSTDSIVRTYSTNGAAFTKDFAAAMVKMSNLGPLTGSSGEVRLNCHKTN